MEDAGDNLKRIDSGAWKGVAGDAFRQKFSYEPSRWHQAGDAFEDTATALDNYASTLRWAQGQATEAIALYEEGEAATRQARAEHDRAAADANARNQTNAAAGDPARVEVPLFSDPGEEKRQAARDMLNRARQQLTEAGDRAGSTIQTRGDEAPEESLWDDVGDGLAAAGDFVADFGQGVWDTVSGTSELLWDLSPHHLLTDPDAYEETWNELGDTAASAWNDPVGFLKDTGKAMVGWEHWKNGDPGRAIGQMVSGAALAYGAGKVASTVNRLRTDRGSDTDQGQPSETEEQSGPDVDTVEPPPLQSSRAQIEKKYDNHAEDFGVTEPRGKEGFQKLENAVNEHVDSSSTIHIDGTYRGDSAILHYNSDSGLVVVQKPSGEFVSGWKLSPEQTKNVRERGSL